MKKLFYILSSLFLLVSCGPTELTEDEKNLLNQLTEEIQSDYREIHVLELFVDGKIGKALEQYIIDITNEEINEATSMFGGLIELEYISSFGYGADVSDAINGWTNYCVKRNETLYEIIKEVVMAYDNISNNYTDQFLNSLGLIENGEFTLSKQKLNELCKFLYKEPRKIQKTDGSDIHKYFEPIIIASLRNYTPPVVIKTEYVYEEEGWLVEYSFGDSYLVKFYEDEENGVLHMKYEPVEVEVIY